MDKLDKMIKEAVSYEDQQMLEATQELGYLQLGLKQFTGKLGWVTWVIMIVQTGMFIAGAWCMWEFGGTGDILHAVKWGISGLGLLLGALALKLSLVPQMQADRIIREVKRVELLLVSRTKF